MKIERILVVLILFITAFGLKCEKSITVPENLIGVWGTTDPNYADRTFKITRGEIIFQTGENSFDTYTIQKIEMEKVPGGQTLLYIFHYKNIEGLKYKFSFYYNPTGQGEIRYKNQSQIVWTKKSES
jgi:hypothetical protein